MQNSKEHVVVGWIPGNKITEAVLDVILLLAMSLVVAFSVWLQSIDPQSNWFMRSGAIVVLVGATLEYRHNDFLRRASATSIKWASGVGPAVIFEQTKLRMCIGYIAHVCVVVGTFIAAYGDLIFARVQSLFF